MDNAVQFAVRDTNSSATPSTKAILFLHGFSGNAHETFGMMPAFLAGDPQLNDWDIYCFGYPTSISLDVRGVWSAEPDLTQLSKYFAEQLQERYYRYKEIALIAHSMGGLIVQRGLLDCQHTDNIHHVILFGTPSRGLRKASLLRFLKRQIGDMAFESAFIEKLRREWDQQFSNPRFGLKVVLGLKDQFVSEESALEPFAESDRRRVAGNHLEMVKPRTAATDCMQLVVSQLLKREIAVPELAPLPETTDLKKLADYAIELERVGRWQEAIDLLKQHRDDNLYLPGALAGRYKQRWMNELDDGKAIEYGELALETYSHGFVEARNQGAHRSTAYLAINVAFMQLGLRENAVEAARMAEIAKAHTEQNDQKDRWMWYYPTIAEALLHLGDDEGAIENYSKAPPELNPRERASMFQQAILTARLLDKTSVEAQLQRLVSEGE